MRGSGRAGATYGLRVAPDFRRLLLQPGGVIRLLPHEIEVNLVDSRLFGVVLDRLAPDAIEIIGAADHREALRPPVQIALEPDIAESADLAVQVSPHVALLARVVAPARATKATDLVGAVVGVKEPVLEPKCVPRYLVAGPLLRDHGEVVIERNRRGCHHGRAERSHADHNRQSPAHLSFPSVCPQFGPPWCRGFGPGLPLRRGAVPVDSQKAPTRRYKLGTKGPG